MAKFEKRYPNFECSEYDYGSLQEREYYGAVHLTLKFADGVVYHTYFDFKDFLDFHKRKKSSLHRLVEKTYSEMRGWGSRYFELIERLQEDESIDLFEFFAEFIELVDNDLSEKYQMIRSRRKDLKDRTQQSIAPKEEIFINDDDEEEDEEEETIAEQEVVVAEKTEVSKQEAPTAEEEEDEEEGVSPYELDRKKFDEILKDTTDDIFESLKTKFFPQMEYFQRRYPTKWKLLIENIESVLLSFEIGLLQELMPQLNDDEYREYEIKYNSEKADMSADDEPPSGK
jgi:hypothetical protein